MRFALCVVALLAGCGNKPGPQGPGGSADGQADPALAATRWLPAKPTYAFAARTVREAQRGARDLFDTIAAPSGESAADVGRELSGMLGVDAFSDTAVANIGIDVEGSVALFSDGANPTLVVHLSDAERLNTFFEQQRERGLSTQSVIVDGAEVFTAKRGRTSISWAVADGWLWVHFILPMGKDDSASWFTTSRKGAGAAGAAMWTWARGAVAAPESNGIVGFGDPAALFASLNSRVDDLRACFDLLSPVSRIAFGIDGENKKVHARIAVDVGASAPAIAAAAAPVPAGWDSVATGAPLAAQWNLDVTRMIRWAAPCMLMFNEDGHEITDVNVKSGRAILLNFDPDEWTASEGVASLDLTSKAYFAGLLDQIPLRSSLEKKRTFGPYQGARISVPFGPSVEYVLTDSIGFLASGEGVLERAIGNGAAQPAPLAKLDVELDAMPPDAWQGLVDLIGHEGDGEMFVRGMAAWSQAHARLSLEGSNLVLDATAIRR